MIDIYFPNFVNNISIILSMKFLKEILLLLIYLTVSDQNIVLSSASTLANLPTTSLSGSLRGGPKIYIHGIGFPSDLNQLQVLLVILLLMEERHQLLLAV